MTELTVPNHHSHHGGFAGIHGVVAALSMVARRDGDAELAARLASIGPGDTVVDIGCGPGAAVRHFAGLGATVTGVDPAAVMLRTARLLSVRSRSVRFVEGSAEALPVADGSASVAVTIASVHHWTDLDGALDEVRRVLVPNGRFVAMERSTTPGARGHASHGWTTTQAEAFAALCGTHGFVDTQVHRNTDRRGRSTVSITCALGTG